jgi:alpha,alpha-trehalase
MIPSALERVDEIARRNRQVALFLDFDGTLTPIVSRPEQAVLSDSVRQLLRLMADQVPVAIFTGRDLDDIRRRVDIDGIVYAGSHGFDIAGPRGLRKEVATEFLPVLDLAETELKTKLAGVSGAQLERKRFSVAAHYRNVSESDAVKVKQAVDQVLAHHHELRRMENKKVYELLPGTDWDKGKAVIWILDLLGRNRDQLCPLYIGDDVTDEDAFRAIEQNGVGIVVTEEPRSTAAHYALKDPPEVEKFLRALRACLGQ